MGFAPLDDGPPADRFRNERMQDAWVRIIEFKDKLGEMYVHRLLKLEPELQDILKPLDLSKIGDEFFEIMDTVRLSHVSTHTYGSLERLHRRRLTP